MAKLKVLDTIVAEGEDSLEKWKSQGFTMSDSADCFVARTYNPTPGVTDTKMTRFPSSGVSAGQIDNNCGSMSKVGHANDCAFYNGTIFIAQGDQELNISQTDVASCDTNLNWTGKYKYKASKEECNLERISAIAYIKWNWFLVGYGGHLVVAYLDASQKPSGYEGTFVGISKVTFSDDEVKEKIKRREVNDRIAGQGIFCDQRGGFLYKVYSHYDGTTITENDIVSFALPGRSPSFSGSARYDKYFALDAPGAINDTFFFCEAESISSPNGGKDLYVSATTQEKRMKPYKNIVYHVQLNA